MTRQKEIYKPTPLSETVQLRVRFSETDPLGIVWHGNYIKYFEEGREAFGRKYGISYLEVETHYMDTSAAKLVFQYYIYNEQKELVCTGETVQVFTHLKEGTLCLYNPEFYTQWKEKHLSHS